jgi:hypothetical protein
VVKDHLILSIVVLSGVGFMAGCSSNTSPNPIVPQSTLSHVRHVRDNGAALQVIGSVTSVTSFNALAAAGFVDSSGQLLILQPKNFKCSDPTLDTCRLPCDDSDPDCAPQFDLAVLPPALGAACFGSPAVLGNNIPFGSTDTAHEIVDIVALGQSSFANGFVRVGWIYKMGDNQTAYTQDSGDNGSYFQNSLMNIPALGQAFTAIANAQKNSYIAITTAESNAIVADYSHRRGRSAGSCFTKPLLS